MKLILIHLSSVNKSLRQANLRKECKQADDKQ